MNKSIFTLLILLTGLTNRLLAQTSPNISASIFYESFDANTDYCGNDGIWGNSNPIGYTTIFDNSGWQGSNAKLFPLAQCIRIGDTEKGKNYLTSPSILLTDNETQTGKFTFRAGIWTNDQCSTTNLLSLSSAFFPNGTNTTKKQNLTIPNGSFTPFSFDLTNMTNAFTITFGNSSTAWTGRMLIDDVTVYQDHATATQQKTAKKIVLTGDFTAENVSALNENLKNNEVITNIDASAAIFPAGTILTVDANKNCLIISKAGNGLSNTENVIIDGTCAQLNLYDGHPFHSDYNFTATNISYDRAFTIGTVSTTCLPFSVSSPAGVTFIGIPTGYTSTTDGQITIGSSTNITADHPCLITTSVAQPFLNLNNINASIKPSTSTCTNMSGTYFTFAGSYNTYSNVIKSAVNDYYRFCISKGSLVCVGENSIINPFRAYFSIRYNNMPDNASSSSLASKGLSLSFDASTDGIESSITPDKTSDIYNLQGMLIRKGNTNSEPTSELPKGIYIINHKKIAVQ